MEYSLKELIDLEQFQTLQDRLNEIYPFPSAIIDNEGNILTATAWQDICKKFHRVNKECEKECIKSDQYILEHLHEANPAVSYQCPHGLIDNAIPIIIDGKHLGNFFTGQFFLKRPDKEFFRKQAKKYGFDEETYLEAVKKVPVWTKKQLNNYLIFIKGLIEVITTTGLKSLREIESNRIIRESEEAYRFLFESVPIGIGFAETGGKILNANKYLADIMGYDLDELMKINTEATYSDPRDRRHLLAELKKNKHVKNREVKLRRKDNSVFDALLNIDLIEKNGKQFLLTTIRDITKRKQIEDVLKESEEKFRTLAEQSPEMIFINKQGKVIYANTKCEEMMGYTKEEFYSPDFDFMNLIAPESKHLVISKFDKHKKGEEIPPYEYSLITKSGNRLECILTTRIIQLGNEKAILGTITDITERKKADKALRESEEKYRNLVERANDGITIIQDNVVKFSNPSLAKMWGGTVEEIIGIPFTNYIHPDEINRLADYYKRRLEGENVPSTYETILKYKDGNNGYAELNAGVIMYNGRPADLVIVRDITERKRTEETLHKISMRYETILNEVPDIIMEVNNDKIYTWANHAGYKFFGDDVIGKEVAYYFVGNQDTYAQVQLVFNGEPGVFYVESLQRRKDGESRLLAWWCRSLTDSQGKVTGALSTARDITESKQTEDTLRKFSHIFQNAGWGMAIADPETNILQTVNPAFARMHGYTSGEMTGMNLADTFAPESRIELPNHIRTVHEKSYHQYESVHIRKDGSCFFCKTNSTAYKDSTGRLLFRAAIVEDITERKQTEKALQESEKKFSIVFDNSPNSIEITKVADDTIIDVNEAWIKTTGYSRTEVIGKIPMELGFWQNTADRSRFLANMKENGRAHNVETRLKTKSGEITGLLSAEFIELQGEQYILWEFLDLTDRLYAEKALKSSEERYRFLVEQSPDAIVLHGERGIVFVNNAAVKLIGAESDKDIIGKSAIDFVHPDYRAATLERIRTSIRNMTIAPAAEEKFIRLDGHVIDVEVSGMPLEYDGKPARQVIIRDITNRKQTENQLKFQAQLLSEIGEAIIATDSSARITYMNNSAEKLYGWQASEALGQKINDVVPSQTGKTKAAEIINELKKGNNWSGELIIKRKDGSSFPVRVTDSPVFNEQNELTGIVGISSDITDRKKAEILQKIQYNIADAIVTTKSLNVLFKTVRNELNMLIDASNLFIALYDEKSGVLSSAFVEDEKDDIPASWKSEKSLTGLVIKENKSLLIKKNEILKLTESGKIKLLGSRSEAWLGVPLEINGRILGAIVVQSYDNPEAYDSRSIEILEIIANQLSVYIERQRAEETAIKLSKGIEQSPVCIVITDSEGTIEYVNPKFTEVTGFTFEEAIGKNPSILKSGVQKEEFYKILWDTILSGNNWQGELCNRKKNGEYYWENAIISPVFNNDGVIIHFIGIKEDITEKKKMVQELIAAKEKAEDSDRLKSAFLANISHEIRTPMNAIVGFSELLLMPGLESEKQEQYAGIIKQRSFDLLNIINDILDISIIEAGQMKINEEPCNIGEILSDIYLNCKVIWIDSGKSNVSLSSNNQLIEKGIRVITDSKRLRQILLNLLGNAFKFTSDGSIEYGCMLKENDTILFYVSDTGIGIEPSKKDIIFQRFRQAEDTTTRLYGGAGLGLSISKGLLELMGGNIWVDSEQGKGSTFYFTIPYKLTEIIPEQMISTQEPAFHWGNKKMLIVEDDKYNAEYLKAVLYVTGIQITHVVYGEEALNLLKSDHNFDLLLLDIKLPDIDGYELARKIKSFCSKIPIIAETAYASEDHKERCFEAGCDDYLSKPTSKSDLMTIMSKHLQ